KRHFASIQKSWQTMMKRTSRLSCVEWKKLQASQHSVGASDELTLRSQSDPSCAGTGSGCNLEPSAHLGPGDRIRGSRYFCNRNHRQPSTQYTSEIRHKENRNAIRECR